MSIDQSDIIIQSTIRFKGQKLTVREDEIRVSNGIISHREIVEHPEVVVIIPMVTPSEILLIQQYRTAAGRLMIEVPAGVMEPGEIPIDAALRELREETAFGAKRLMPLFSGFPTPGFCTEYMHFFVASDLYLDPLSPDADEVIESVKLPIFEAVRRIQSGEIVDLKTIAGIFAIQSGFGTF